MRYLLDTNVVSELRKRKPHGAVLAWLQSVPNHELFVASVTLGELQAGVELTRTQDPAKALEIERWIEQVAALFSVLPMDTTCFREWGRLMRGTPGQLLLDAMIAATARVHGLALATRNTRDFSRFDVSVFNPFSLEA